jgi:hypothetical protein
MATGAGVGCAEALEKSAIASNQLVASRPTLFSVKEKYGIIILFRSLKKPPTIVCHAELAKHLLRFERLCSSVKRCFASSA